MSTSSDTVTDESAEGPWHRDVTPRQWRVWWASTLGWLFDGYEGYAIILVLTTAMTALIPGASTGEKALYGSFVISGFLFGWATGGVLGGILADTIGRKRTMVLSILVYAIFTGVSGFSTSWEMLLVFRFLAGVGVGAEWANGASLIAETWSRRSRTVGLGLLQSGYGWGQLIAAAIWLSIAGVSEDAWRWLFFVGAVPALLTIWIRRSVDESGMWQEASADRSQLRERRAAGEDLDDEETTRSRSTLGQVFADAGLRRLLLATTVLSLATTVGFWAISTWIPAQAQAYARAQGAASPEIAAAIVGITFTVGAILGYVVIAFTGDHIGRRRLIASFFVGAAIITPLTFFLPGGSLPVLYALAAINGFFTLGQFGWMPVYLPELFPTAVRGTAASFVFSTTRYLAAIGPLIAGLLVASFGGYGVAASVFAVLYLLVLPALRFLPETARGRVPVALPR